jgi:hypothetical protein
MAFDPVVEGVEEKVFQGDYQLSELSTGWWPQLVLANESGGYDRQGVFLSQRADGWMTYIEEMSAYGRCPWSSVASRLIESVSR